MIINFNKIRGCAEVMQKMGKDQFYNGGKYEIFRNAFLWRKTGPNKFIYHSYMHSIALLVIN